MRKEPAYFHGEAAFPGVGSDLEIEDLTAFAHMAEEGGYWAEVPALPGCFTQGETFDQLIANLNEAIAAWLEVQTPETLSAQGIQFRLVSRSNRSDAPRFRRLEFAA